MATQATKPHSVCRYGCSLERPGSNVTLSATTALLIPLIGWTTCHALGVKTYGLLGILSIWIVGFAMNATDGITLSGFGKGAIHCGTSVLGIPSEISIILQELRGAGADIAGLKNCLKAIPPRGKLATHHTPSLDLDNTSTLMQFLLTPQLLAAILSELHASRLHIAKMHARMRWLPKLGSQPAIPNLQVSPSVCAIPENLASIVTELREMRVDLAGMHSRLQILPGAQREQIRKRSRPDPGTSPPASQSSRVLKGISHVGSPPSFQTSPSKVGGLPRPRTSSDGSETTEPTSSSGGKGGGPTPFSKGWLRRMCGHLQANGLIPAASIFRPDSSEDGDSTSGPSVDGSFWEPNDGSFPSASLISVECTPSAEGVCLSVSPKRSPSVSRWPTTGEAASPPDSPLPPKRTSRSAGRLLRGTSRTLAGDQKDVSRRGQACTRRCKGMTGAATPGQQSVTLWEKVTRKR